MSRQKIILIRLDKIGDLICSLPVDQIVDENKFDVTWIIQKGMGQIVDLGVKKRKYFELDKNDSISAARVLAKILSEIKPDIAISFQVPWWVNFELFKARIPLRSGVRSQWHSFLFLNQGLRQKRSLAIKHEFEYNLDLVRSTLQLPPSDQFLYFEIQKPDGLMTLNRFGLRPQAYFVVHPGMMGSALNWKPSQYIEFIRRHLLTHEKAVLTGTASDENYWIDIKNEFAGNPNVINLQSQLNFKELIEVLSFSEFVLVPSTGVAHLAASVGAKVLGIYSPIRVHHPRRWAPRGPRAQVFLPQVQCPASHLCLKLACPYYNCMDSVSI